MKAPDAFRTISEVAEDLDLPQHVLRFWETRFNQIKPMKRGGGRRYYRPEDVELLRGIRVLLYAEGFTIRGVQRLLKEKGVAFVAGVGQSGSGQSHGLSGGDPDQAGEIEEGAETLDWPNEAKVHAPGAATRREPEFDDEARDEPAPTAAAARTQPKQPFQELPRLPTQAAELSQKDRRRMEFVLADLLEAKRLLDQAR